MSALQQTRAVQLHRLNSPEGERSQDMMRNLLENRERFPTTVTSHDTVYSSKIDDPLSLII